MMLDTVFFELALSDFYTAKMVIRLCHMFDDGFGPILEQFA